MKAVASLGKSGEVIQQGSETDIKHNMMMIVPNSRARKGRKERGEVMGSMEELEGSRMGMLTTREWCNPVSNMLHHVQKGLRWD